VKVFEERPDIRARLEDETVIWLTTVNVKGQPQSSPVWFLSTADHVVVYSLPDTPRVRNIRANPRVSLNLNSTRNGDELVIIEGRAEIIEGAPTAVQDDDYMAKYDEGIIREGMTAESFSRDYPVRIHVHPTRLRAT
jgi:PPOX class probable F420-dependent enzyme